MKEPVARLSDSFEREGRLGLAIIALFFGVLGVWAAFAPLDAGVVAQGIIKVSGNRHVVSHREGGIVSRVNVREGAHVSKGQILVELAGSQESANEESLALQLFSYEAMRARLAAELIGAPNIAAPSHWQALSAERGRAANAILEKQSAEMTLRRESLRAQLAVLKQREHQSRAKIASIGGQISAIDSQGALVGEELEGLKALAAEGFAAPTRVRGVERLRFELAQRRAALAGEIESTRALLGETRLQELSLQETRNADIGEELRTADMNIAELTPKWRAAREAVERTRIRALSNGVVVGIAQLNAGASIAPGQTVLELVPDRKALILEVRIHPRDADNVAPGKTAIVRLTALESRRIPQVKGTVVRLSADRLEDPRTGEGYFTADIHVDESELARIKKEIGNAAPVLSPGLPVEAVVALRKRSALQYLVEPLSQSLWRSFRQS